MPETRQRKPKKENLSIPSEYKNLDDDEIARLKKIGDAMQSLEKGNIQKLKAAEAKKDVIATKIVIEIFTAVLSKLKSNLYAASSVLPAQLEGKGHTEIQNLLFSYIDSTLEQTVTDFDKNLEGIDIQHVGEDDGQ